MLRPDSPQLDDDSLLQLVRRICEELSIDFSANDVRHVLADVGPEGDSVSNAAALAAVGKRLGLRIREMQGSFRELKTSTYDGGPLIVVGQQTATSAADYFVVLRRLSRRRIEIFHDGQQSRVTYRWLKKHAFVNASGEYSWFMSQPIMAAQSASAYDYITGKSHQAPSPIRRLLGFLRPEARDIRVILVFSVVVGILSLTTPLAVEALVNTISFGRYLQPLVILSLMVFVFLAFKAGIRVMLAIVVEILQRRIFVRVVDDLAYRLVRVPLAHFKEHHGPELVNRFFDVVSVQKLTSKLLLETLMLILQTAIGLTVLAFYHPFLLGYGVGLLLLMTVVITLLGRGAAKSALKESVVKYQTAAWLQEIVRHPTTFKFNGGMDFVIHRADELAARYVHRRKQHFRILIRQVAFSVFMQAVAATVLLGLGGYLVINAQMTLGQLIAAELIVAVILGSFAKIGQDLENVYDLLASIEKLGHLFDLPGEPIDRLQMPRQAGPTLIELVDVRIGSMAKPLSRVVAPGNSLALFGRSGSGKSRLIESIAGQIAPDSGYILVNDFRVDLLSAESLQSRMALVRDIEIFQGTIDENLKLGREEIGSDAVNRIITRLNLHETISGFSNGYNTQLNISGYPLSTSQAVMLLLARALVVKPGAVLIDGLLDGLPDGDLPEVLHSLSEFRNETTIVIATGRRAIADWADGTIECG